MQQHCGGCTELDHYLPQPRHGEISPRWSNPRATQRADCHHPAVVEVDHGMEKEVHVAAGWVFIQMHVTDWAEAQREDPLLSMVLDWLEA